MSASSLDGPDSFQAPQTIERYNGAKFEPNDVDLFLIMHDTFDLTQVTGEARLIFDHAAAQAHFGASVFWLRGLAALPNEEEAMASWQIKRDGTRRGIVEVKETKP